MEESLKDLKRISWVCSEEEYRADPAYSYSILAKYNREGFNKLDSSFFLSFNTLYISESTISLRYSNCLSLRNFLANFISFSGKY